MKPVILYKPEMAARILGIKKRSVLERAERCSIAKVGGLFYMFTRADILKMARCVIGEKRGRPAPGRKTVEEVKAWFEENEG